MKFEPSMSWTHPLLWGKTSVEISLVSVIAPFNRQLVSRILRFAKQLINRNTMCKNGNSVDHTIRKVNIRLPTNRLLKLSVLQLSKKANMASYKITLNNNHYKMLSGM